MSGGICSIISAALVAMGITFGIMPFLLDFCRKRGYYDLPGGRKVHHCAIPRLGGLLFMPSMLVALVSVLILSSSWWQGVLTLKVSSLAMAVGAFLIYIIGTVDDLVGMKPNHKFAVQLVAALLMPFCGLLINNFYGLFGLHELPVWFSYPFTVFVILLVVNSINLIDGIDGLASGLCICILAAYIFLLWWHQGCWVHWWPFSILICGEKRRRGQRPLWEIPEVCFWDMPLRIYLLNMRRTILRCCLIVAMPCWFPTHC